MTVTSPPRPTDLRLRFLDAAALGLLVILAFWLIGPAGRVLAGGDLFTYFYPYWSEATRAVRAGRLPLWNPYLFMGVPFLANSQVGALYPFNVLLWLLLPPERSLHWSVLLHLWLAAAGAYAFGRCSLHLSRLGAWTAGAVLALGGYLGAQVEHLNQLQALAWSPWLLVLFDRAVGEAGRRAPQHNTSLSPARRLFPKGAAFLMLALVVGLVLLAGHTQSAFIILFGLAVHALAPSLPFPSGGRIHWRALGHRAAVCAGAIGFGVLLAAAQLLPTMELTRLSVRAGGLPFSERVSFSLSPLYLARAIMPGYGRPVEPENLEYVATVGVSGLVLILLSLRRRAWDGRPWPELLAGLGLFLAMGMYNPLYLLLARFVPGFAYFRAPARWLALWALGAALLVGQGVEVMSGRERSLSRRDWAAGGAAWAVLVVWGALGGGADLVTVGGWVAAGVLAAGLIWLRGRAHPRAAAAAMTGLVLAELIGSARTLPHARATAPQAYTSLRPAAAHLLAAEADRCPPDRFLSISALVFDPGDLPELRLIYGPQLSPKALYDLIVATKQREVLSPNLPLSLRVPAVDGYDGGILPLARFVALERAFLPPESVSLDGRLRENLTTVPDGRWLSLLNVRYVITDKVFDAWIDHVFYDLQFGAHLRGGESAQVATVPPFEATALGLVSYLEGADGLADGTLVGRATVALADGATYTFPLQAGTETAEGVYRLDVAHAQATVGGHFWPGHPEGTDYVARLRWDPPGVPLSVTVRALPPEGQLVVRGVSLIDERSGSFQSLVLSDQGRFRLVHSGDVKVYENLDVLPRAFVARCVVWARGTEEALTLMQSAEFDPMTEVVLEGEGQPVVCGGPAASDLSSGAVRVLAYEPQRVELGIQQDAPAYLILTDAAYPGWRAWVDGEEARILNADLLFRAVWVGAGSHRVVFAFDPPAVRLGAAVSLAGLGLAVGLLAGWGVRAPCRCPGAGRGDRPIRPRPGCR